MTDRSQALLTYFGDGDDQVTSRTVDDLLLYDTDLQDEAKAEEDIEVNINFEDLQKKFDEIAKVQREREDAARDYVNHLSSFRTEEGESLVHFPENFDAIVRATIEEAKSMEDLKDKGIVSENEIEKFIREQLATCFKQQQQSEKKKEEYKSTHIGYRIKGTKDFFD